MATYTVAGVTYDEATGVPVSFEQNTPSLDYYTGPQNALVGSIEANGVEYGVYANYDQTNNQVQDSFGNVIYENFTNVSTGNVAEGYAPSFFNDEDIQNIQSVVGQATLTPNVQQPSGLSNIPPEEGNAVINGEELNPQFGSETAPDASFEFGKVDKIIKKLSLRNLVYPVDADFGNTQDYMQIDQFTYRPPNQDLFFPKSDGIKTATGNNPGTIFTEGVQTGSPKEEFLGLVKLPMPNSLADSNNVSWGADQLNALTAAVSSAVFGQTNEAAKALRRLVNDDPKNTPFGSNLLGKILQAGGEGFDLIKNAFGDAKTETGTVLNALNNPNSNISVLGSAVAGSALLNFLQFGVTPESVLARGQGVVPNNNLALLFNSPTLREFTFTWKMTPRSREEATRIKNIIRFFKQGMAPKKGISSSTGGASYFLGTPNVFDIKFKTTRDKYDILNENDAVVRIKTCACTGTAVNYTPDGMWNAYEKGQPVSVTLSLRFSELEPIFDTDYDENAFNYDESRAKDLRPVPIDAVGY